MALPAGFCEGAAFDRIAPGIFITAALHGAKVIIDEKGTEAAAATALAFAESAPPAADLTIVADRPFLWTIVHQDTEAILFVGRLVDPGASQGPAPTNRLAAESRESPGPPAGVRPPGRFPEDLAQDCRRPVSAV